MKPLRQVLLATLVSTICSTAFAAGSDDLWEMKSTLKSGGQDMAMPASTSCMPKGQTSPPVDKTCKATNQGGLGGKFSSVVECPGPPPTTMKIEGTRTATTMQGTMTVFGTGTNTVAMLQEFSAKLVGTCDAAEFAKKSQGGMSMGGGMPGAGMSGGGMPGGGMPGGGMPGGAGASFDPSTIPSRRPATDAASSAAKPADAAAAKEAAAKEAPKDATTKTIDAAKKALGGLLPF